MTLIPLISAIASERRRASAPAGNLLVRGSYDAGAGHRPVAALLAVGLPAALVVAVALSPMVIEPKPRVEAPPWTSVMLPKPKTPEPEVKQRTPAPAPPITVPDPVVDTRPLAPVDVKPLPPIEIPASIGGTGDAVIDRPVERPVQPKLVLAQFDPRFADRLQPDYPASEQRREIEGSVTVRVLIGTDGRVKAVERIAADSSGFFEATKRQALTRWRFKPATRGGVAEESWKVMTVHFQIRDV